MRNRSRQRGFALAMSLMVLVLVGVTSTLIVQQAGQEADRTDRAVIGAQLRTALLSMQNRLVESAPEAGMELQLQCGPDQTIAVKAVRIEGSARTARFELSATTRGAGASAEVWLENTPAGWTVTQSTLQNGAW
jgi:Tfp pilus assembly protein PilX